MHIYQRDDKKINKNFIKKCIMQKSCQDKPKSKYYIVNESLNKRGVQTPSDSETPSATAMGKISATLVKMMNTDKKQGVTATEVQAFKNQVTIYLDQALTYESFLER
ncbi:MAG: hypothetical protein GY795_38620 [Desulfobacterales bacterium]|nr:hypothetical protein [Desulfobacterales bacterium]